MKWHDEELALNGTPSDVLASLIGKADVSDDKVVVSLCVYISHMQETASVVWKSKTIRLWKQFDTITAEDISDKFAIWVSKFHSRTKDFLQLIRNCAIKAKPDAMKWFMAKYQFWK